MLSILGGLISVAVSVLWILPGGFGNVGPDVMVVIKGSVAIGLIFGGLIAVAAGISAIKENAAEKKEQAEAKKEEPKKEEPAA
ncbi:MAG: hypothetical protein U9O97_06295 [Elusimicrobiota bacterium]|nr:hypothetical protein [Elusimicrobiota bacterium]